MQDKTKVRGNVILMELCCSVKRKTVNTKPCIFLLILETNQAVEIICLVQSISEKYPSSPPKRNELSSCMRLSHKLNNEFYIMGR